MAWSVISFYILLFSVFFIVSLLGCRSGTEQKCSFFLLLSESASSIFCQASVIHIPNLSAMVGQQTCYHFDNLPLFTQPCPRDFCHHSLDLLCIYFLMDLKEVPAATNNFDKPRLAPSQCQFLLVAHLILSLKLWHQKRLLLYLGL